MHNCQPNGRAVKVGAAALEGVKTGEMIGTSTSWIIALVAEAIVDSSGKVFAQRDKLEEKSTLGADMELLQFSVVWPEP